MRILPSTLVLLISLCPGRSMAEELTLDEKPAGSSEWGYRPAEATESPVNPPAFCWRPQKQIVSWELACKREDGTVKDEYSVADVRLNVHCPPRVFPPGEYSWRYRGVDAGGKKTNWSRHRGFTIPQSAVAMPMPSRQELLARIPKSHPRLFVRPEDLPRLRELAQGPMKEQYDDLVSQSEALLKTPPPTEEPKKYPKDIVRGSDPWRKIWWGNRTYTTNALNGAATLAFTRLLGGKEEYGQAARRILMECAEWDPKGATGYRYNDEAGMPYNYYFSRAYTFVYDLLSEEERQTCRNVMKIRGEEMYRHLCPRHLWRPYSSHSNRAWHFLGEVGIAFQDEVEGADDWVWFAMNVFYNTYPVWCDDDGGWHEGTAYWSSYLSRFTWWADVMRSAMDVNAFDKPFFSRVGYYPMYLMPPGKVGGGFGDLTATRTARSNLSLTSVLAAQSGNGHWQWYVEQMGGPQNVSGYVGFVRGALPKVTAIAPDDLPSSRLFEGTGQAYLNSNIRDADESVQVVFKSSPFGSQSHGYEANNSFLLWGYGKRLLIRTGRRDSYGSGHHRNWMWTTRSVNSITVDGIGQGKRTSEAKGRIVDFKTTPTMDLVTGEAAGAYKIDRSDENPEGKLLDRFTRSILFVKPDLVIVYDRLAATREATFEYWLHAVNEFTVNDQRSIEVRSGDVGCSIDFMEPPGLTFAQTDQYDPNPRERIKLREWHLTASTPKKSRSVEFVTLMRPHRADSEVPSKADLQRVDGGYILTAGLSDGQVTVLLPTDDSALLTSGDLSTKGKIVAKRVGPDGSVVGVLEIGN